MTLEMMPDIYIAHKISRPALHSAIVHRETLIEKFNAVIAPAEAHLGTSFACKLVLLSAPAGYGKTTLLADFAHHTSIPCCWYFLDHTDADSITFLRSLLASIRRQFPRFGLSLDSLLAHADGFVSTRTDDQSAGERLIDAFTTAIAAEISQPFAIFLCNYHHINEHDALNALVKRLLQQLPSQCLLVIESRSIPKLEYVSLVAGGKIVGIGSRELRFTAQEVQALSSIDGEASLSKAEAEEVVSAFDGWIVGILLGTRMGSIRRLDRGAPQVPARWQSAMLQGESKHLFDYIADEVFGDEPDLYAFLKEAALLQDMAPTFCDELLRTTHAADYLERLEQKGLFIARTSAAPGTVYTCHPVLRELFYNDLRQHAPERFSELHQRAARLFYASQGYEQAIYHALEAQAWELAARFLLEAHEAIIAQGHGEALAGWIDTLIHTHAVLHPKLLLIRAQLYTMLGESGHAHHLLEEVTTNIADGQYTASTEDGLAWQVEQAVLYGKVLFLQGDYPQAQEICQSILESIPADKIVLRAEVYTRLGMCANLLGNFRQGISQLQKALHLLGRNTKMRQTAELHGALASTYGLVGNFALAEHHLSRAIEYWEHLGDERGKIENLICMGQLKQYQGDFLEAEASFMQALTSSSALRYQRGEAYTLVSLGELYQDQGNYDQAVTFIDNGLALAHQIADRYLVNYTLCALAMTYILTGDMTTARLLLSEANTQIDNESSISYEASLFTLTYGTMLLYEGNHEKAIFYLAPLAEVFQGMGLKRELFRVIVRLAACQLALGNTSELMNCMHAIVAEAPAGCYSRFLSMELARLPELQQFVQTQRTLAHLRNIVKPASSNVLAVQGEKLSSPVNSPAHGPTPLVTSAVSPRPRLSLHAFGEPEVSLDGQPLKRWRVSRALELCFFLLNSGRPVHKEQIIAALWPDADNQLDLDHTLRTCIYHLRKTLGGNCVAYQNGAYMLDLSSQYEVEYDVAAFMDHYALARKALAEEDSATAKRNLLKMLELYQGHYVQTLYSDWPVPQRDALRRAYLEACHMLARMAWEQERIDECLHHWQQMLAIDPCLEEAHYGIMRCYLHQGKRGLALRQYQQCVKVLRDELQVAPGPNLQKLYQRLQK